MKSLSRTHPHSSKTVIKTVGLVFLIAAILHYQDLIDEYTLSTYKAPADIAALSAPLGLTRTAQAILDRANPRIDSKAQFNNDCQTQKGELELGCYANGRIYVLKIDNPSLQPEMEAVLAHELLHAAWTRLSPTDQKRLGILLEADYKSITDADLAARMADYAKTEPGEETNELHSILGTEQATVIPDLEKHYAKYFKSRSNVVTAHMSYEKVFADKGNELTSQLGVIKTLKTQLTTLNARMERLKTSGQITSYNALVPSQNRLVDQINSLITTYDEAVDEYNALSKSLDSQEVDTEPGV